MVEIGKFGRHLERMKEKLERIKSLLENFEKDIKEAEEKFKELDLPEIDGADIKQLDNIMQHLARANMLAVFANTSHFRSIVKRVFDETGDILQDLAEELDRIKIKTE